MHHVTKVVLQLSREQDGKQWKTRVETDDHYTKEDEKKCAELLKDLVGALKIVAENTNFVDFIAVYEKSDYADITFRGNNSIAANVGTIMQAKNLNPTERFAFEAFMKQNVPRTEAQKKDLAKKVKRTAKQDEEKAAMVIVVDDDEDDDEGMPQQQLQRGAGGASSSSSRANARNAGGTGLGSSGKGRTVGGGGGGTLIKSNEKMKAGAAGAAAAKRKQTEDQKNATAAGSKKSKLLGSLA